VRAAQAALTRALAARAQAHRDVIAAENTLRAAIANGKR